MLLQSSCRADRLLHLNFCLAIIFSDKDNILAEPDRPRQKP